MGSGFQEIEMKRWLQTASCMCVFSTIAMGEACFAQTAYNVPNDNPVRWQNSLQNWRNTPDNWPNSPQNWQNSSQNWANSPQNWKNNPDNFNSTNGIYDRDGNRVGYAVPRADGSGVNYYDNGGRQTGYQLQQK
jgi:hypothetical protein